MPNFGLNVRRMRKSNGPTQADLATVLEVSRSTVALMEQGKRNVRAQEIEALAATFGCSTASIFTGTGPGSESGDESDLLAEIGQALSEVGQQPLLQDRLGRTLRIASTLTDLESRLGLDGGSLGPNSYDLSSPKTAWEATQQGILAAAEERRRLSLGESQRDALLSQVSSKVQQEKEEQRNA